MSQAVHRAIVQYDVARSRDGWEISEETIPESVLHDEAVELLKALLAAWAARAGGSARVVRNLAVRWDEANPRIGVDPDVCVLSPSPPDAQDLRSVHTWLPEHAAPALAVEVVSETNPHKDYSLAPEKYAASAVGELWIFDPLRCGPRSHGGPFRIQVWSRTPDETFVRLYAGEGPAFSPTLGAWLVASDEGRKLRIAADEAATAFWLTSEESERAAKETERAAKDTERAAKEQALARVAELEAELARRR
ncbi:MAG: Uma2 family endonuclease [Labilithrix sp.]|nr:Uma2 family endonuclease [Labilithrix sp.]